MKTLIVWYMVTSFYGLTFSPPLPSEHDCRPLLEAVGMPRYSTCVRVLTVVGVPQ